MNPLVVDLTSVNQELEGTATLRPASEETATPSPDTEATATADLLEATVVLIDNLIFDEFSIEDEKSLFEIKLL